MNAEQIEKLAKQAGLRVGRDAVSGGMVGIAHGASLTRFAELVAADARAQEFEMCIARLMGLHAAEAGRHNYFKWAAVKLREFRSAAAIRNTAIRSGG
jgi:hypothetical protein